MTKTQVRSAKRRLVAYRDASKLSPAAKAYFQRGHDAMDRMAELIRAAERAANTGEPLPAKYRYGSSWRKKGA